MSHRNANFTQRYGPWALVAGGSEGLGRAWSVELARRGLNLIIIARRSEPLDLIAAELRQTYGVVVETQSLDLSRQSAGNEVAALLDGHDVGFVVYNAAIIPQGLFNDTSSDMIDSALAANCHTPTLLLRAVLPRLYSRSSAGVVLVSSLAGYIGTPKLATYAATKAYLRVLGEGLWSEARSHGTDIIVSCPGAISTPNLIELNARRVPGEMSPLMVVTETLRQLGHGPAVIPGRTNRVAGALIGRILPTKAAIMVMRRSSSGVTKASGGSS